MVQNLVLIALGMVLVVGIVLAVLTMMGMRLRPYKFGREQEDEAEMKWLAQLNAEKKEKSRKKH